MQRFSVGVLQEFFEHAIPDLVKGTDLLDCHIKKMTIVNVTIAIQCE